MTAAGSAAAGGRMGARRAGRRIGAALHRHARQRSRAGRSTPRRPPRAASRPRRCAHRRSAGCPPGCRRAPASLPRRRAARWPRAPPAGRGCARSTDPGRPAGRRRHEPPPVAEARPLVSDAARATDASASGLGVRVRREAREQVEHAVELGPAPRQARLAAGVVLEPERHPVAVVVACPAAAVPAPARGKRRGHLSLDAGAWRVRRGSARRPAAFTNARRPSVSRTLAAAPGEKPPPLRPGPGRSPRAQPELDAGALRAPGRHATGSWTPAAGGWLGAMRGRCARDASWRRASCP